jgi:hypothetical protein
VRNDDVCEMEKASLRCGLIDRTQFKAGLGLQLKAVVAEFGERSLEIAMDCCYDNVWLGPATAAKTSARSIANLPF